MTAKKKSTGRIITATPKTKANEGADDLEILNPNREITIAGKVITVREYKFIEGLGVRAKTKPFLDDLYRSFIDDSINVEQVMHLVSVHHAILIPVIAQAADVDVQFVESLGVSDGNSLIYVWWSVNGPFFNACVTDRIVGELKEQSAKLARAGQMSTTS
jgi:hypothetical protein